MNASQPQHPDSPELSSRPDAGGGAADRWSHLVDTEGGLAAPELAWQTIHAFAQELSGRPVDGRARGEEYWAIYQDSQGNFMFPLIATHGSLWGITHTIRIQRWLTRLKPLSRHGRIDRWLQALDAVRDINRRVFVEIYTTFYFTRHYGELPQASDVVKPEILALYNQVHRAIAANTPLTRAERRDVYYDVFVHEQNDIVDPGIQDAAAACGNPWLVNLLRVGRPRFRYFPEGTSLKFTDFTNVDQRNREGLRALEFAERVGPTRVREAMAEYPL